MYTSSNRGSNPSSPLGLDNPLLLTAYWDQAYCEESTSLSADQQILREYHENFPQLKTNGRWLAIEELSIKALAAADRDQDKATVVLIHVRLASSYYKLGNYRKTLVHVEQCLLLKDVDESEFQKLHPLNNVGKAGLMIHALYLQSAAYRGLASQASGKEEETYYRNIIMLVLNDLDSYVMTSNEGLKKAKKAYEEALDYLEKFPENKGELLLRRCHLHLLTGEIEACFAALNELCILCEEDVSPCLKKEIYKFLARYNTKIGKDELARLCMEEVDKLCATEDKDEV